MSKKIFYSALFCLLSIQFQYAQTDFRKGFIIDELGRKVIGFLNYKENSTIYSYCEFKPSLKDKIIKYTPNQIKSYGFDNDKLYVVKEIETIENQKESKFLEVIIQGKATLYKLSSTYYIEINGDFKVLDNRKIEFVRNSRTYRTTSKKYIELLQFYLKDYSDVVKQIKTTKYTERGLLKLFSAYNACSGEKSIIYKKNKPWLKAQFGVAVGLNYLNLTYQGKANGGIRFTSASNPSTSAVFGGFTELSSPRTSEKISLYTGLFYSSNSFINSEQGNSGSLNYISEVVTELKQLSVPIAIRYTFPERKLTPYFTVGATVFTNLNSSTKWSKEYESNQVVSISRENFDINKFTLGFISSIGLKKRLTQKLFGYVDLVYENAILKNERTFLNPNSSSNNHLEFEKTTSIMSNLHLLIGIRF